MRVSDVAFLAGHLQPDIGRSAPTDFHHIAESANRGGFADQAQVGNCADAAHMIDQRHCAKACWPFFVAGYDEADRASNLRHLGDRADHRRDRALHINRAAPIEQTAAQLGRKRCAGPAFAGGHDIDVSRESEMAAAGRTVADREQIFDRSVRRFTGMEPVHRKTQRFELTLQTIEHQPRSGGDAGASDQRFGQIDN